LAQLRQAEGDFKAASQALQKARELAIQFDAIEVDDHVVALAQARLWIAQGRFDAVERWAEERHLHRSLKTPESKEGDAYLAYHLRKYEHLVLARLYVTQQRPEEALALLEPLLAQFERRNRFDLSIEALTLQAVALASLSRQGEALAALEQALTLAEPGGYARIFLETGPAVARLLPKILAHSPEGRGVSPGYVQNLLAAWGVAQPGRAPEGPPLARQALLDPLTEREMDVLRLLATGMSNPEIADSLVIAVSTVRSHLKNIYSKLDVHKRWDAVQRAEELGLL
jgi:LuxR family maltose regulon positive regulatory protein